MLNYQRVPHVAWIQPWLQRAIFLSWKWRQQIQRSRSRILSEVRSPTTYHKLIWLVVSTPLKNISQLGWLFNMQQVPLGSLGTGPDDPDVCRIHLRHPTSSSRKPVGHVRRAFSCFSYSWRKVELKGNWDELSVFFSPMDMSYWLVVEPPLWKIWVRQLGLWHSQLIWEKS